MGSVGRMTDEPRSPDRARCAIRVDASPEIGAGHLRRCLTLADRLAEQGAATTFLCRRLPDTFAGLLRRSHHELVLLPLGRTGSDSRDAPAHAGWLGVSQAEDAQHTRSALGGRRPDWLIVDHYALDYRWERELRAHAARLMVIDDLADRSHECDVLLDQNYFSDLRERYHGRANAACRQLLGPRYALLRPEFHRLRDATAARSGRVARVLVFFGGADPGQRTRLALEALDAVGRPELQVDVVTGAMNSANQQLAQLCAQRANTRLFTEVEQIAELMAQADLAIGAGGSATWERCCLGLPTLALVTADNQRRLTHDLCEAGFVLCPSAESGDEVARQLRCMLAAMLSSDSLLRGLAARCAALVDGLGAQRVAAVIRSAGLSIRAATETDRERVYEWRNHPTVRGYSRHSAPLDPESHARWFAAALRDPDRALLIAEVEAVPIAVVRFDVSQSSCEVSIYLAPDNHAGGWGSEILRRAEEWFRRSHPQVERFVAEVLPGNRASLGAFIHAGYREHETILVKFAAENRQPQPPET